MKGTMTYDLGDLVATASQTQANIDDEWVPARPLGLSSLRDRLRAAWLAFTGKCDLVRWPKGQ